MENKNNKGIVVVLSVLVIVLGIGFILCFFGLFNKDTFIKKEVNNNTKTETKVEEPTKTEVSKTTGYYQYLNEITDNGEVLWNAREIILNEDGTTEYKLGGNASGGAYYKGTYIEDNNKMVFIGKLSTPNGEIKDCDDNNVQFSCEITIVFEKSGDKLIEKIGSNTYEYKKITKEESRLFNENYTIEH